MKKSNELENSTFEIDFQLKSYYWLTLLIVMSSFKKSYGMMIYLAGEPARFEYGISNVT